MSARERDVLLRELRCVFELVPSALREIRSRAGTDEREDDFLLMKLLSEAARLENGQSSADPEEAEARPERAEARSLGKVAAKPEQDEAGAPS